MAATTELYSESPTFVGFKSFALTFVFAGKVRAANGKGTSENFRLAAARANLAKVSPAAYRDLVLPTQSFFSDILATEIPLQRRPLIVACEPESSSPNGARRVELVRPKVTRYFAEGRDVAVQNDGSEMPLEFRDAFSLFESGHLFYALSFIPCASESAGINEYHIITLQKLVNPTEDTEHLRESVKFRCSDGKLRSLVEFVAWRQSQLAAAEKTPNAVREVLRKMLGRDESVPAYSWDSLRSLLIAIEDRDLFGLAKAGDANDWNSARPLRQAANPHMAANVPDSTARHFALAGLVQGVADFPFQDESEIHDSLEPIVAQADVVVFSHPKFMIEIGPTWRSLTQMRRAIGSCPYVLLTHLTLSYNEFILEGVEQKIEALIYDVSKGDAVRAQALGSLERLVYGVEHGSFSAQKRTLKAGLQRRVEIYRDLVLGRLPNIFRYPRERDVFERVSGAFALERRYATCIDLLANHDGLSDDVHALSTLISDRSMNSLLSVISALSAVSILSVATDYLGSESGTEAIITTVAGFVLVGLAVFVVLRVLVRMLR